MRSPKPEKEDPNVVAAREREERRAENMRTEETQALLIGATQRRLRRYGSPASGGSVPIYAGSAPSSVAAGGGGGVSFSSGGGSGGGGGSRGGGGRDMAMLY